ncbi:MAG TPA: 3-oxoacyl-[acyl-carrier-protein] synthase III C-terminal domain-containing protein [Myxococcales bacterium]|nr:3-oxoacyl-[acyl-carrier-protein] synthase III C-terminal domain-containing protein [Myxococcales bacterium]
MVIDDGGGGTPYAIDFCGRLLHGGQARTAAIVASSFGVTRSYFHQPTRRVVDQLLERTGLPAEKVAITVDRYGCTHAAGMLISLVEDLESGEVRLGGEDCVVLAGVGANVHGQVIRP